MDNLVNEFKALLNENSIINRARAIGNKFIENYKDLQKNHKDIFNKFKKELSSIHSDSSFETIEKIFKPIDYKEKDAKTDEIVKYLPKDYKLKSIKIGPGGNRDFYIKDFDTDDEKSFYIGLSMLGNSKLPLFKLVGQTANSKVDAITVFFNRYDDTKKTVNNFIKKLEKLK